MRRESFEIVRRLREHDVGGLPLDDVEDRVRESGIGSGRDEMERVAEMPADGPLRHVGADQPDVPLAVLAQRTQECGRPGGARRRDENRDRLHERSIRSSASCCSASSRLASSMERIDSPIVAPS